MIVWLELVHVRRFFVVVRRRLLSVACNLIRVEE
jgi:hypothetical protein